MRKWAIGVLGVPAGFGAAVRSEYVRIATRPWTDLLTMASNAAVVIGFWIFLPNHLTNWAFSLNGPVAFAAILEVWLLADTLATNPFGQSRGEVLDRIHDIAALRTWLWARSFVVWSLVGPPCAAVAIGLGIHDDHTEYALIIGAVLLTLPFAIISITTWVGIRFPYHPRPLLWRWQHRREWRVLARWAILLYIPYNLVLLISVVVMSPAVGFAELNGGRDKLGRAGLGTTIVEVIIACAVIAAVTAIGHRIAVRLVRRRHTHLVAYLSDPEKG